MTPGVFKGVSAKDERGLVAELGLERASERIDAHRQSFISEKDFIFIKNAGFDTIRLPVGYWLFEPSKSYISGESYVDKAFRWANKHEIGIVLDLHGLQGSQNGKMHSGQIGQIEFFREANMTAALETLGYVAHRYGGEKSLLAIEVINEPHLRFCARTLLGFYQDTYRLLDGVLPEAVKIVVADGFQPRRMARMLARRDFGDRLVLDIHVYQVFGKQYSRMPFDEHMRHMANSQKALLEYVSERVPIMVGEWSGALPGAAKASTANVADYVRLQQDLYNELAWGWMYWSYKKQGKGAWNGQSMLANKTLHVA